MSRRLARLVSAVAMVAASTGVAFAQDAGAPENERTPMAVAGTLAGRGVSGGVVTCWVVHGENQQACDAFNRTLFERHEGGVVHVRTVTEPRRVTELLHRSIHLEAATVPAIEAVLTRIVHAVRGDHSGGGASTTDARRQPVELRGGTTTLMQALDDIVRQGHGFVWWIAFEPVADGGELTIGLASPPGGGSGVNLFPLAR